MRKTTLPATVLVVLALLFSACGETANNGKTTSQASVQSADSQTSTETATKAEPTSLGASWPTASQTIPQQSIDKIYQTTVLGFEIGKLSAAAFDKAAAGLVLETNDQTGENRFYYEESQDFYCRNDDYQFVFSDGYLTKIDVMTPDVPTALGIKVGDSIEKLVNTYGEPAAKQKHAWEYYNGDVSLLFGFSYYDDSIASWSISTEQRIKSE